MSHTTFRISLPDDQVAFIKSQANMRGVTFSDVLSALIGGAMRSAQQPAGDMEDTKRLVFIFSEKSAESTALVKLAARMLDNDFPTIEEVRAAIDSARKAGGEV